MLAVKRQPTDVTARIATTMPASRTMRAGRRAGGADGGLDQLGRFCIASPHLGGAIGDGTVGAKDLPP